MNIGATDLDRLLDHTHTRCRRTPHVLSILDAVITIVIQAMREMYGPILQKEGKRRIAGENMKDGQWRRQPHSRLMPGRFPNTICKFLSPCSRCI